MDIRPGTPAAYNVVSGWLGLQIPPPPRQRRRPYRKTARRRSHTQDTLWSPKQPSTNQTTLFSSTTS